MTTRRGVALTVAGVFGVLLLLLVLAPLLFRAPIEARVKRAVTRNVAARVDWRRVQLGIFRDFPDLTLQLHDLTIAGTGPFARDTLLGAERFRLVLDLGSVLRSVRGKGPLVVRSVMLSRPVVQLLVLADGRANWDILRERSPAAGDSARALDVSLRRLEIGGGRISLENRQTQVNAVIAGLRHQSSGDFAKRRFTLRTATSADTASLSFAGVPYLRDARVQVDADLDADTRARRFTLRENRVRLNELLLRAAGTAQLDSGDVALDLTFDAPRTEFRELLSLVPALYRKSFATLRTSGTMAVEGRVRGRYGERAFPAFAVSATVENGEFRYPDLPLPARDIALHLAVRNPGGHLDSTVLDVDRFRVTLGSDAIAGAFVLRTPLSDPDVALRVNGRLDLASVPRTIKLDSVQELAGIVTANAALRARLSDVRLRRFERVDAQGTIALRQLALRASALRQPLHIEDALLRLTPQRAELASLRGRAGSSALTLAGSLDNLLGYALGREALRGSMRVSSPRFELDEWRSDDELKAVTVPGNIEFTLDARADTVRFGQLLLRNAQGVLRIKDRRVALQDFRTELLGGSLALTGFYQTLQSSPPSFDVALDLLDIDVPAAFAGLRTVQAFAPAAKYAEGNATVRVALKGALGDDMLPVYAGLSGLGSLVTNGLVLRGFPGLDRLADALRLQLLHDPGFVDLKSSFRIDSGRLHVQPFDVRAGPIVMNVAGSNGIDQSLDYTLALRLPRALLGTEANRAVERIVARTAPAGFNLQAADTITLAARLTGTVTSPVLATSFRAAAANVAQDAGRALREEAERRRAALEQRVDSAATAASERARAEAARRLAEAEQQAAAIREEAKALAEKLRTEAYARADSLQARATSPAAKIGARLAADRLKKEADAKAEALLREAEARAAAVVEAAKNLAGLTSGG